MSSNLSETLLSDLRVDTSTNLIVDMRENSSIKFPAENRAMLHFILRGTVFFRLTGSDDETKLQSGDSVLVFYGDSHSIGIMPTSVPCEVVLNVNADLPDEIPTITVGTGDERASILTCALELAYLSPFASANRAAPDFSVMRNGASNPGDHHDLLLRPAELERCCRGTGATAFATTLAGFQLVNFCRRWREELWSNRSSEIRDPNARRISAALRLMHTHPARRWTVSKLAAEVGLSRSSFAQEFAHCLESTPLAYLTEVRMKRAAYLLEQGRISCQEVAIRVGYSLENSFSRAFKRRFGFSPRAYAAAMCGEQVAEHVPFGEVELARGLAPPCVGDPAKIGTSAVAANEHPHKSTLAIHEVLSAVAARYCGTKCA